MPGAAPGAGRAGWKVTYRFVNMGRPLLLAAYPGGAETTKTAADKSTLHRRHASDDKHFAKNS
jgi:hypothetical protein